MSKADPNIHVKSPIIKPEDINDSTLAKLSSNSLPIWCQQNGLKIDGNLVDFENHRYLLPIYMCTDDEIAWMKSAQVGATSYQIARLLWFLTENQGRKAALYMPTRAAADNMSSDRIGPVIQSCPPVAALAERNSSKLSLRKIGDSSLYIMHLGGQDSKDSVPLDLLCFDEVRLVSPKDIDQTMERIAHSSFKQKVFMSTCGNENDTIHARFDRGSQHIFRVNCGCSDGCDLARTFPECVVEDKKRNKLYLRCPKCKYTINDGQNGRYVPMNSGADYTSFHCSQLNSRYISLKEIWNMYKTTTNKEEFVRSKLGLPYTAEENRGVTLAHMKACVNLDAKWTHSSKTRTAMGVDVGATYLYVTINDVHPDGTKIRDRHYEIIERYNPIYFNEQGGNQSCFVRLQELMKEFSVGLCVVDAMPERDAAQAFAMANPGKVYLAWYQPAQKDMVIWGDRASHKEGVRKAGDKYKFKNHVLINRFSAIQSTLADYRDLQVEIPNPDQLIQRCKDEKEGTIKPEAIAHRFFDMCTRMIKQFKITNEETGEGRWDYIYTGLDPHFVHSKVYARIALERLRRSMQYSFA